MEANMYEWAKELDCAVTVCDRVGTVIYQNDKSVATNGSVSGRNLEECHNPKSWAMICKMLREGSSNTYTISKKGQKKLIYQTPWFQDGFVAGLVELSIVIPEELPHFKR